MKCPKCHYVSFDPEPRCRHCGYGFSLADAETALDAGEVEVPASPPAPPRLVASAPSAPSAPSVPSAASAAPEPPRPATRAASRAAAPTAADDRRPFAANSPDWEPELIRSGPAAPSELPLFVRAMASAPAADAADEPLVRVPSEPRPPLAVRRPSPEPAPARRPAAPPRAAARRLGPLDRDLLEDLERIERAERASWQDVRDRVQAGASHGASDVSGGIRLAAAALDAIVIGSVSVVVLWLTLRWCDLPIEQMAILPAAPMLAFLSLVLLGYLVMFTAAGGQTIGKMAFGLRVVRDTAGAPAADALTLSQAAWRALLSLPSVCALGLGLLPALLGRDQAIHDRLAHTRVVRV